VHVGELQVWDVVNETPAEPPFHLHGFFFQVLKENGVANETIYPGRHTPTCPRRADSPDSWLQTTGGELGCTTAISSSTMRPGDDGPLPQW
jgi:FtsP/CotA-like multicopper oxidase with cupredoxin domain